MPSPIPRALQRLVRDRLRRHAWNIGVSHFTGDVLYMDQDKESARGDNVIEAEMVVDRRYLHATLKVYPAAVQKWREQGEPYIEHLVAHEVAHVATAHLYEVGTATYRDEGEMKDAWETLTEVVARLSMKLEKDR